MPHGTQFGNGLPDKKEFETFKRIAQSKLEQIKRTKKELEPSRLKEMYDERVFANNLKLQNEQDVRFIQQNLTTLKKKVKINLKQQDQQ